MPAIPIYTVDAFSTHLFSGNPAAVCLLEDWPADAYMQNLAAEMNLSETAFLRSRGDNEFDLRWMTPAVEVDLCGHAALASAHVLWSENRASCDDAIRFHTRSGVLTATRCGELIELDFPAVRAKEATPQDGLLAALGVETSPFSARNEFDWLVELDSEQEVRELSPDFRRLGQTDCRGVIATAVADHASNYDYVSRFFAPASGIDEDPVTGSAHCCLGPHWTRRLERNKLTGFQASQRGGLVQTEVQNDRVMLRGAAVMVIRGELLG